MSLSALKTYVDVFTGLTPGSLHGLGDVMTKDIHFADPFNDVRGLEKVEAIFAHMFELIPDARFDVHDMGLGQEGDGFLYWTLTGTTHPRCRAMEIVGMSRIAFEGDRVRKHIDYWDAGAQVYEEIPVFGGFVRAVRRKLEV